MTKLDDQIARYRKELERRPPGDTRRKKVLFNLADSWKSRFLETGDIGDLEEKIGLYRTVLALHPEGHPHRHWSLDNLAWCLQQRYRKEGALPDLEEAITLGKAALRTFVQRVIQVDLRRSVTSQFSSMTGTKNWPPQQTWRKPSHSVELHWTCVPQVTLIVL